MVLNIVRILEVLIMNGLIIILLIDILRIVRRLEVGVADISRIVSIIEDKKKAGLARVVAAGDIKKGQLVCCMPEKEGGEE